MQAGSTARLERIRSMTDNYFFWQGLRLVPMGAALMVVAWRWSAWWPLTGPTSDVVTYAALALAVWGSVVVGRYYRRSFGDVRAMPGAHARRNALKWLIVYPLLVASMVVDGLLKPPLFVTGPVWGAGTLAYWWSTGRGRPHYVVASGILGAFGLLPLFGVFAPGTAGLAPFFAVLGAIYMVGGVLDHLELRRLLRPVVPGGDTSTV